MFVPRSSAPLKIFQSAAAAAFHSAVNDGARFLICLIFRSSLSPDYANGSGVQADRFPAVSGKVDDVTAACSLKRRNGGHDVLAQFANGTAGRLQGQARWWFGHLMAGGGLAEQALPNAETFEMLRRSSHNAPFGTKTRRPCQLSPGPIAARAR